MHTCGISARRPLSSESAIEVVSRLSIKILPPSSSASRSMATVMLLFPAPVRPHLTSDIQE
jgi:hypothetical protein